VVRLRTMGMRGATADLGTAGVGRVLVSTVDRGVDRDDPVDLPCGVDAGEQHGQHPVPGAVSGPSAVPGPHGLPGPEPDRKVTPRDTGAVAVDDRFHDPAVVGPGSAPPPCAAGQQDTHALPLLVREPQTTRHRRPGGRRGRRVPRRRAGARRHQSMFLITRAGTPATTVRAGTSWVTTAPAATTAPAPMVTPWVTTAAAPIQTSSSITIGALAV